MRCGAGRSTTPNPLCSFPLPWASNNGGTAGGVVFFDLAVSAGVLINAFDCNCSGTTGTSVTLEVYTTPNTYVGNETNAAAWTLVAPAGPVLSAARHSATTFTLASPLTLNPGNYAASTSLTDEFSSMAPSRLLPIGFSMITRRQAPFDSSTRPASPSLWTISANALGAVER